MASIVAKIGSSSITDEHGEIDLDSLREAVRADTALVSVMLANNETGVLFPVNEIGRIVHERSAALFHVDGVQAVGKMQIDLTNIDLFALSGHKLHAPQGIGALYLRKDVSLPSFIIGGAQEQGRRAGTSAVPNIVGLGAACDYVSRVGLDAIHVHEAKLVSQLREALRSMNDVRLFGPEDSAGIVSFALDGIHPHDLGTILDEENVAIRAGHHCAQPLMDRLGVPATARASFGLYSSEDDVAALLRGIERTKRIFG